MRHYVNIGIPVVAACCLMMSCSTKLRIENAYRKNGIVNIRQPKNAEKKADTVAVPKIITYKDGNGKEKMLMNSEKDEKTGEDMPAMTLGEVTVTAKSKTVPERNGIISIPFVVTVPKDYAQKDWRIIISPVLDNDGIRHTLKPLSIAGTDFRTMDRRREDILGYRMKKEMGMARKMTERKRLFYPYLYRNDSTGRQKEKEYGNWKKEMDELHSSWVLDTIISSDQSLSYYYKQEFPSEEMRRKLKLYFTAKVEDLGKTAYYLREGDTLNYFISSMTQFLDRTPRYVRETILRKATERTSAYIYFPVGSTEVTDTLHNNREELEKVSRKMREINEGNEFVVDSIVLLSTSSPEGNWRTNEVLAKGRAEALKRYLDPVLASNAEAVELVKTRYRGENWEGLEEMLKKSDIPGKEEMTAIIEEVKDPDERELRIAREFPGAYEKLKKEFYPKLRAVDFVFHLSRRGMVEDVMYTDVIDTAYAAAISLMDDRKYKEAMPKLLEYKDMNTAICYMSLGYNGTAVNILLEQPETADREYLLAILYARLGMEENAVQLFLKSCRMDESKIERGELDPEISALIKKHNLNEQLYNN